MGGHTAVDALIIMPYLREEQHRAGGKGQGCALVGQRGRRLLDTPPTHPGLYMSTAISQPTRLSGCPLPVIPRSQAFRVTHVLYPVDLRRGLGRGGTGQGHSPTRRNCSTFRLNQQLNALWRPRLWVGTDMKSIRTPGSWPDGPGIDPCLPESQTGPALPTHP